MVSSSIPDYTWQSKICTWPNPMAKQLGLEWSGNLIYFVAFRKFCGPEFATMIDKLETSCKSH